MCVQWVEVEGPLVPETWPPPSHRVLFDELGIHPQPANPREEAHRLLRRFVKLAAWELTEAVRDRARGRPKARDLAAALRKRWNVDFDDAGAIGRRYRRQDEIGTPFCVTDDFDTLDDNAVTVRERETIAR